MRVRWGTLTLVLVLGLAACGSQTPSSQRYLSVPINRTLHPGIAMKALLTGRLAGRADTQHRQACLWIADGAGRTVLLWPSGYVAENDPLRILNRSRKVVGTVGHQVSLGGGSAVVSSGTAGLQACGPPTPTDGWIVAPTTPGG